MTELKPCPFCNGGGIAHRVPTGWRVSCSQCSWPSADTEAEAIAVWNTRPSVESIRTAKEALRRSQQGWENVVEMGLLPARHWETANNLSNDCLQALATLEKE